MNVQGRLPNESECQELFLNKGYWFVQGKPDGDGPWGPLTPLAWDTPGWVVDCIFHPRPIGDEDYVAYYGLISK